jgi:tetratricopeptide (TPR) repeat protein
MQELALFRGSSRLEYRNQNIKLLRAHEGEVTRAAYRSLWVDEAVHELLEGDRNPIATAVFVDGRGSFAFPVRQLMVQDHDFDPQAGVLNLRLEIGPFVQTRLDFDDRLPLWAGNSGRPPDKFVTVWEQAWPSIDEVDEREDLPRWREAVDFLLAHWPDYERSAFLRLLPEQVEGESNGPALEVLESARHRLRIYSYNPHLTAGGPDTFTTRISHAGALVEVDSGASSPIDPDGEIEVAFRCLEPGAADLQVEVIPDPQFSTYLPIKLSIIENPAVAAGRPHSLGAEWHQCLDGLAQTLSELPEQHAVILRHLERVFPQEPTLLRHIGRLNYQQGDLATARVYLDKALTLRNDAETAALDLFAALRRGDRRDALMLLERLNLSHEHDLFDRLLEIVGGISEPMSLAVAERVPEIFSHEKASQLLHGLSLAVISETGVCRLASLWSPADPGQALRLLESRVREHPEWEEANRTLVELAESSGETQDYESFAIRSLTWKSGEDPHAFIGRWERYSRMVTDPATRTALLWTNVKRLTSDEQAREVACRLAVQVAEAALAEGSLFLCSDALTLVFANASDGRLGNDIVDDAREVEGRLLEVREEILPWTRSREDHLRSLYVRLRPLLAGKTLLVVGSAYRHHEAADEWATALDASVEWLTSTPSSPVDDDRIRARDPRTLLVVCLWEHMSHLKPATKEWLKRNQVPLVNVRGTGGVLIEELADALVRE